MLRLVVGLAAGGGPSETVAGYGILGIATLILVPFAWRAYRREVVRADAALSRETERADKESARADRLESELRELNKITRDNIIPALTNHVQSGREVSALVEDLRQTMRDVRADRRNLEGGGR